MEHCSIGRGGAFVLREFQHRRGLAASWVKEDWQQDGGGDVAGPGVLCSLVEADVAQLDVVRSLCLRTRDATMDVQASHPNHGTKAVNTLWTEAAFLEISFAAQLFSGHASSS